MVYFERIIARANARFMVMSGGSMSAGSGWPEEDGGERTAWGLSVIDHYNGCSARTRRAENLPGFLWRAGGSPMRFSLRRQVESA